MKRHKRHTRWKSLTVTYYMSLIAIAIMMAATGQAEQDPATLPGHDSDVAAAPDPAVVSRLVGRLDEEAATGERSAWLALMRMVHRDGSEAQREVLSDALVNELHRDHPTATRRRICELLGYGGTRRCVDPLYKLLLDERIREDVRQALIRLPYRESVQALVAGLQITEGDFRIALLDAIGQKGDPAAFPILYSWSRSRHEPTARAAREALSRLPSPFAMRALRRAMETGAPGATAALLRSGQALMAAGRPAEAREAFRAILRRPDVNLSVLVSAIVGLGRTGTAEDVPLIAEIASRPQAGLDGARLRHAADETLAALRGGKPDMDRAAAATQPAAR